MPTIDLTPEQLHAHITGLPLRTGIYSDFNACMHRAGCQQTQAAHVVLLAEVEALRKDAERYRWLRDKRSDWEGAGIVKLYAGPDYSRSECEELDQQVDAAMLAAPAVGAA